MPKKESKEKKEELNIKAIEKKWQGYWQEQGIFKFDSKAKGEIYSIDTPPPTVSGKMHIGHSFSYSQQDFIIRYKRMKGFNIFYPFGTDDNGLPTERLVEKTRGIKARDFSREEFINICMDFLEKELPRFIQDWRNIGISCDFDIYYSTINEHSRRISQRSFIELHKMGRAYRKDAPAMWCPECQTGISQVECQDKILKSKFNYVVFKINGEPVTIATTRPELLPACVAVFYNPNDKRYKKFKGARAEVPLFNLKVAVMEDSRVSIDKGTGIVMCCTFGDQVDMEWQKAYNLPIREAIGKDGRMNELAGKYKGLKMKEAREKIIEDLKKEKLVVKEENIEHAVNVHERCGTEIEFVKSRQWFIKYLDLRDKMLEWGKKLKWYPEFMRYRYDNWVKGLQWDWLISNQRYFGVPFPVWYCKKCGEVMLADEKQLPVDPLKDKPRAKCKCGSQDFEPERDILNTWFTSSMTPRLAIELMPKNLWDKLFPMNLRPQASEIITFWLFNTVVKSNLHYRKNPFKDVMVSGFVTLGGQKMSKSRGNIVEPRDIMEKYGADALRFWAASSKLGEDVEYQEKELVAGQKTITKIWNAARFVSIHLEKVPRPKKLETFDLWLLSKLNQLVKNCTEYFDDYEYSRAKADTEQFFWKIFCDNYLEIIKKRVYQPKNKQEKESAQYALYTTFLTILKLFAPIMPFITEEIYQEYFKKYEKEKSVHVSEWPKADNKFIDEKMMARGDEAIEIIGKVRQEKTRAQKSLKAEIILTLEKEKMRELKDFIDDIKAVANAKEIKEGKFDVKFL